MLNVFDLLHIFLQWLAGDLVLSIKVGQPIDFLGLFSFLSPLCIVQSLRKCKKVKKNEIPKLLS